MNAAQHALTAKDEGETAIGRMSNAIDQLRQAAAELSATADANVEKAASHMRAAESTAGSSEAGEVAQGYDSVSQRMTVATIMQMCDDYDTLIGQLHTTNQKAGELAARFSA